MEISGELILADKSLLIKKVMFYREQTDKLRQYIFDTKIGEPCQNLFDVIYDRIKFLENKIQELENDYMAIQTQLQVGQFLKNKRKNPQRRQT